MSSSDALLEIEGMCVRLGREQVLRDVDLCVERGSCHCIVGPNGAGKSTLLAALLGRVDFQGRARCHWRRGGRIGFVPQRAEIDASVPLSAAEFLMLERTRWPVVAGLGRRRRRRSAELLTSVGLAGRAAVPLNGLSGGELQRLLFANALDPPPELLMMDEPTSGLDLEGRAAFNAALSELRRARQPTILMVSHDLAQVRGIADRVTVLDRSVLRSGPVDQVLRGTDDAGLFDLGAAP